MTTQTRNASTLAVQAPRPERGRPLVQPIVQSTTYLQEEVGATPEHAYSRVSNPTVSTLERVIGELEDAPPSVAFASGLAAETALFLALLRAGDHVVCGREVYGGTTRFLEQILSNFGVSTTFVDATDTVEIADAIRPETRLVFIETPANPTLRLTNIRAVAALAKDAGAYLVVDNTFLTGVLQRPLDLGADAVVYATTKHIEGHSAACGGAIVSRDGCLLDRLRFIRKSTGAIQTPFNAFLTLQGIKTLPLRLERHSSNAQIIAEWLESNEYVSKVNYPGLASFPQRELADQQHLGAHGGVLSFEVVGGTEAGARVMNAVELCALVEHVGSVESLVTHPASMTHADVKPGDRRAAGIEDGLIRLSVGLESVEDIIADLDRAIRLAHDAETLTEEEGALCHATA